MPKPKTVCATTKEAFLEKAKLIEFKIGEATVTIDPREFTSGSFGWNANQKIAIKVDGKMLPCQLGMNIIVIGSKPQQ